MVSTAVWRYELMPSYEIFIYPPVERILETEILSYDPTECFFILDSG